MFLILATTFTVTPVLAQGLFDTQCPLCHGTGGITVEETCDLCQGNGEIIIACPECNGTGRVTCKKCAGSGKVTTKVTCPTCSGTGVRIVLKEEAAWEDLVDDERVARIQGVFYNGEDKGVHATVTAFLRTKLILGDRWEMGPEYEESTKTYFAPHENVTVTIDIKDIDWYYENWEYNFRISAADGTIPPCPDCGGSGLIPVIITCPDCGGMGELTCPRCLGTEKTTMSCPECGGDGKVESKVPCPRCGGSGHVTDWTRVGVTSAVGVGAIIGVAALAIKRRKRAA